MKKKTFSLSKEAMQAIGRLRGTFDVGDDAGVIRKALALSIVAARYAENGILTIATQSGPVEVRIDG